MSKNITGDNVIERRNQLRSLTEKYISPDNETVYEQAVRYGKIAHEAYCRIMNVDWNPDPLFDNLSKIEQQAWIEVGTQIERFSLKENKD